jgi:acyl carrier protein
MEMKEKVISIFARVFEMPIEAIEPEFSQSTLPVWDSIMHLNLIAELETELDILFEPEEIEAMKSLKDIIEQVGKRV